MSDYKILADSCCDIPDELLKDNDIDIINFYVCLDGRNHLKERVEITTDDFYSSLCRDETLFPKTSFPPIIDFLKFFRAYLEKGLDILYISMTSKFSSAFSALANSVDVLKDEFPDRNIILVDSMQVSMGEGLIILEAARMKKSGKSIFEVADFVNDSKLESKLFCTVDSLSYLQKGGRIGKVAAIAGDFLNIKPIIKMKNGELCPSSKVRGRKKAIAEMISQIAMETRENLESYRFAVFHSCSFDEAESMIKMLKDDFGVVVDFSPTDVGVIIGSHIGPGVLAVSAVKKFEG